MTRLMEGAQTEFKVEPPSEELLREWATLALETAALPFLWPQWSASESDLRLATGRHAGKLIALAPLVVTKKTGVKYLRLAGADYCDVLVATPNEAMTVKGLIDKVREERGGWWDAIDFRNLAAESNVAKAFTGTPELTFHNQYPQIHNLSTWDEYLARLSKKFAWQIQYDRRRLERDYPDFDLRLATKESLGQDLDALISLHQARWTAQGEPGAFPDESSKQHMNALAEAQLEAGHLRLFTLRLNQTPAAALLAFEYKDGFLYYTGGFDTALSKFSPGKVVLAQAIRTAIEEEKTTFDFMLGDEDYKQKWAAEPTTTYRLVMGANLKGNLAAKALVGSSKRKEADALSAGTSS